MDDDDYVDLFAFEEMERALFLGARPLMVTGSDVRDAYSFTMEAAANAGSVSETRERIVALVARETFGERFVTKILSQDLGLT